MNRKIILTGGGTAGHVTPNIALLPELIKRGWDISYIGSKNGIENRLVGEVGIPLKRISCGKIRRYADVKNLLTPFGVLAGIIQSLFYLRKQKPSVIFSKGGFVAVPVVIAAKLLKIPVVCHESDITPGLANKISSKFADCILVTFEKTLDLLPSGKARYSGTPIRSEIMNGNRERGLEFTNLSGEKPIIFIMGGSQGSVTINNFIRKVLPLLIPKYDIIHSCGKNNIDESLKGIDGYVQYEYINEELPDVMKAADIAIARSGANSIFEFLSIALPSLLIPLDNGSRGDQIVNAEFFSEKGYSMIYNEKDLIEENEQNFVYKINELYYNRPKMVSAMKQGAIKDPIIAICDTIEEFSNEQKAG